MMNILALHSALLCNTATFLAHSVLLKCVFILHKYCLSTYFRSICHDCIDFVALGLARSLMLPVQFPNAAHYHLSLEAELIALEAILAGGQKHRIKFNEATMKFQAAIALASRSGFLHDAALMNERFVRFLLYRCLGYANEKEEGTRHIDTAIQL